MNETKKRVCSFINNILLLFYNLQYRKSYYYRDCKTCKSTYQYILRSFYLLRLAQFSKTENRFAASKKPIPSVVPVSMKVNISMRSK